MELKTELCPQEHITSTAGVIIFAKSHQVLDGTLETSNHCQITKVPILYVSNCVMIAYIFLFIIIMITIIITMVILTTSMIITMINDHPYHLDDHHHDQ